LDVYTAPRLKEALEAAGTAVGPLVLDLSAVKFMDSTALGVLVGAQQASQSDGNALRLVVSDPLLLKIFHITGLDSVFSIYAQLEDALSAD
jgi:anti-sigma B factor antagonist